MIKQTITFEDLDGEPVTEDFWFHLSKSELAEMSVSVKGGLKSYLEMILKAEDGGQIIAAFKDIICKSVGRRSADNRRFEKSQEITNDFMQSNAYEVFFFALISEENKAAEFVNGLIPQELRRSMETIELPDDKREYTEAELLTMPQAQFVAIAGPDEMKWSREHLLIAMKRRNRQPA